MGELNLTGLSVSQANAEISKLSQNEFDDKWNEVLKSQKVFFKARKNNDLDSKINDALKDITLTYPIVFVHGQNYLMGDKIK